jgi:PIN domain nuclease of toxin-antitoxin system
MKLLLDSHAFLWAVMDPDKLGKKAQAALSEPGNEAFVSAVTFWELSLKHSLGKLLLEGISPEELPGVAEEAGFTLLSLDPRHAAEYHGLPKLGHKDPFDRMLVWQAISSGSPLLSKDPDIRAYTKHGLKLLW